MNIRDEWAEGRTLNHTSSALPGSLYAIARTKRTAVTIADCVRESLTTEDFKPVRVLVVDDHPDAADSVAAVLNLLGCPVHICYSGLAALAVAESFRPQVCLIDLLMPGMDGFELAAQLRICAGGRPLLLVAVTALGDEETKARTAMAGFHYHLTKPVDMATLINSLTHLGQILTRPAECDTLIVHLVTS